MWRQDEAGEDIPSGLAGHLIDVCLLPFLIAGTVDPFGVEGKSSDGFDGAGVAAFV